MKRLQGVAIPVADASLPRNSEILCVTAERWFIESLIGLSAILKDDRFWVGSESQIFDATSDVGDNLLSLVQTVGNCDMPVEFRIEDCDLQWRYVGEPSWVSLGNVCGEDGQQGIQGIQGIQGQQGIQGIQGIQGVAGDQASSVDILSNQFDVNGNDQWCYAAQALASYWQEKVRQMAQNMDAASTFLLETSEEMILAGTTIAVPLWLNDLVGAAAEFLNEAVLANSIDYLRQNISNLDVKNEIQRIYFCSLKEAAEANDIENINSYVAQKLPIGLIQTVNLTGSALAQVENFGDGVSLVFGAGNQQIANFVVATSLAYCELFTVLGGSESPFLTSFRSSAEKAQFFDSRDCSDYPCSDEWSKTWNFIEESGSLFWSAADGNTQTWEDGFGWAGQLGQTNPDKNFLKCEFDLSNVTEIEFTVSGIAGGVTAAWICQGESAIVCSFIGNPVSGTTFNKSGDWDIDVLSLGMERNNNPPDFVGYITSATISGTGVNPFE